VAANPRPFAAFDIDGTLIRWQLYHAMANALVKKQAIDKNQYLAVLKQRDNWKNRKENNSFVRYEESLIRLLDKALIGIDYDLFKETCAEVVERYRGQVYTYTRDLINDLKQQNYLLFAISTSPAELVQLVADYYGFDDYGASSYQIQANRLTGRAEILYGNAKAKRLEQLISRHRATFSGSLAVGDTEGDVPMLESAETAITFNPSLKLFNLAIIRHWEIVIERKNVVYHLQYSHGEYVLAPTEKHRTAVR
jgi:HAD superfamily hydrolase (TIGR01490 family)